MTTSLAGLTSSNGSTLATHYSSFLSSSGDSSWTNFEENESESIKPVSVCPLLPLSDQYEEILVIQSLRTPIEPNHKISEVVSRAIARHEERVNEKTKIIENEFKSINDEIERRIFNASRILDEHLTAVEVSLTNILENWKLDDYTRFDTLKRFFENIDKLIAGRNQNIDNFMNILHDLEKERTTLIEGCYKRHMLDVKQLSPESFERLYEKYLKNYNTIKLGNFRTYENLRFKLVQLSKSHQRDYAIRAHEVKLNIKKIMGEGFVDKFKTTAQTIISDKMSTIQTEAISLLDDFNELFNELIQMSEEQINFTIVSKCWDSFRTCSKKLDELVECVTATRTSVTDEVRSLVNKTAEEFDGIVTDSDEYLSQAEIAGINDAMSTESEAVLQRHAKTMADVQSLLEHARHAATAIETVFGPAAEAMRSHLKRVAKARDVILTAIEKKMKTNDMKFNVFENHFHVALGGLLKASTQVEVRKFEQKCVMLLKHIKNRVIVNREGETEVILNYKDLMIVELNVTRSAIQKIVNLVPHDLRPIPVFQNEPWASSAEQSITGLKTTAKNCHKAVCNRLTTLISELKSSGLLNNECMWIVMLKYNIDRRYDKAMRSYEVLKSKVQGGTADKRIGEIDRHVDVLENLMRTAKDTGESLLNKTNALFDMFDQKRNVILNNVKLIKSNVNELSVLELTDLMNQLRQQVDLVSDTFYSNYAPLFKNVKSECRAIEKLISELKASIKTFPEGGNYGQEEAENVLNTLNDFSDTMSQNKTVILEMFVRTNYQSPTDIKQLLSKVIKPAEIELDKKSKKQKHFAINKLMNATICQEFFSLEKMMESLHENLQVFEKTLEKKDVMESSKGWSEILMETNVLIGFLIESYCDIKALLKSQIVNSIWNTKNEKAYITSNVNVNSNNTFYNGKFKFYNYCKTIVVSPEKIDTARFLNNIYLSIFHCISELQDNAAALALVETKSNNWINDQSNTTQIYYEIMEEAVKRSKEKMLQFELIWIFKLSDFLEFLNDIYKVESKFKNAVLTFYHEESVLKLNKVFDEFVRESESTRKRWKNIRKEFRYQLKPSHGHPDNVLVLEALLNDFKQINFECSGTLSDICTRVETNLYKIAENYEKEFPIDILKGATLSIKCESNLRAQLENINITPSNSRFDPEVISEPLATSITDKNSIELVLNNVKQHLRSGTVVWPNNQKLWTENVHKFVQLYRDRRDDVRTFNAVEKSKSVDWATIFVRDVERVKGLHRRDTEASATKGHE